MSYTSFLSIGNPANISNKNVPPPTGLTYISSTTTAINISFTMQAIPGTTTFLPNVGSNSTGGPTGYAINNLLSNTSYSITLVAVNSGSKSIPSAPPLTRLTLPNPPTSLTYTANTLEANRFTCSFTAPSGSEALTYIPSSGGGAGTPAVYIISTLLSNTSYNITLIARNSAGDSTSSTPALAILTLPDPPTALSYLASSVTANQIGISFTAPTGSGTITGYVPSSGGGTNTTSPFTVTGLTSNTTYTITLKAKNASGNSIVSTTSVSKLTLPDPPTALTYLANSVGASTFGISFTAPSGTILSYSPSSGGGTNTTSPFTVTGLLSNTSYTITLIANNATGGSIPSTTSVTKLTIPGAPTIGTATISGTTASVVFTAPGGSGTITGYTATSNIGSLTGTGTSSPISVPGLIAGNSYKFTVTATNASGTSLASGESNIVTISSDGSSSTSAAPSAAYLAANGNTTNGVYWITLPTVGATQVYCILDRSVDGGGWMMAMKATRGTTFQYSSTHWTTVTTVTPTDTTRDDADAKYDTMNYTTASDLLALWPDITTVGGSLTLTSATYSCWSWLQNSFTSAGTFYANTANSPAIVAVPTGVTASMTLVDWFTKISSVRFFIKDAITWPGWTSGVFSSQSDVRFYGFNYTSNRKSRWGFGWNENGGGVFPGGIMGSDDVTGGIGTDSTSYSAGDVIGCCQNTTGINRSARVEIYIRNSANAPSAPTIGTASISGSTATIPFTGVAGASYYTAFSDLNGFYGSSTATPITITGVTTGAYKFTVKASSSSGTSTASSESNIITSVAPSTQVLFAYTGADQSYTIPVGKTTMIIKAWGAGGGAQGHGNITTYAGGGAGGGGYSSASFTVSSGSVYKIIVGGAGQYTNGGTSCASTYGGGGGEIADGNWGSASGGGRSAVQMLVSSAYVEIITAGGGGGAGVKQNSPDSSTIGAGGAGGGASSGMNGGNAIGNGTELGYGGTQTAGGAGGACGAGASFAGTKYTGGGSASTIQYGAGGGGGWYGGGSGGIVNGTGGWYFGGGGGGSSYVNSTYATTGTSSFVGGSGSTVGYNSGLPSAVINTIGNGAAPTVGSTTSSTANIGKDGYVIITII